jgi:protein disulfide-isomerase A1
MDATVNELEDIKIQSFPTIKYGKNNSFFDADEFFILRLFPKGSAEVVDYVGARTVEGFSKFIDSNGKDNGSTAPPAAEEAEEAEGEEPLHEDL